MRIFVVRRSSIRHATAKVTIDIHPLFGYVSYCKWRESIARASRAAYAVLPAGFATDPGRSRLSGSSVTCYRRVRCVRAQVVSRCLYVVDFARRPRAQQVVNTHDAQGFVTAEVLLVGVCS
jgi:hypothetical protein